MIRDLLTDRPTPAQTTDVCIVGAGAAGIALAVDLTARGRSVVLLEAGGKRVDPEAQEPLAGETPALPYRGLREGRARALGGTTNLWGGQILELDAVDFERRPWIYGSGWPFAKSELERYYRRALELEGVDRALLDDAEVWRTLRLETARFEQLALYLSRWCPEPNFAVLHRQTLDGPGVNVWLHAHAVSLECKDGSAQGVRCRTHTGVEAIFTASEYVFCLGAIESIRFFLQPRPGSSDLPWNRSGMLGRHFQDHVDCTAATVAPLRKSGFHEAFDAIFLRGYKYNPKLKLAAATAQSEHLLQAGATFFSAGDAGDSMPRLKQTVKRLLRGRVAEVSPSETVALLRESPALLRHGLRFALKHRAYHPPQAAMKMRVHCEQEPTGDSRVLLSDARDAFGMFRARMDWRISALELKTIRTFVRLAQQALAPIASITPAPQLEGSDEFARTICEDSFHHMGGMRMHASEQCGIVDPQLRLHGTRNVHVLSSAVFPTSGFSNPTHTLLALGVRLAEHLTA